MNRARKRVSQWYREIVGVQSYQLQVVISHAKNKVSKVEIE